MSLKKVTAIFDELRLSNVEDTLRKHSIIGYTIHKTEGRGAYVDTYNKNKLSPHIQMDIYTSDKYAAKVAKIIINAAYTNTEDEGLVSITSVDELFWIHTKHAVQEDEFKIIEPENN
ncbi:P-II family nitrogen regulator [Psychromonas sp. MB-3u-54]|uniref:P-II family nitrogen regulator n=1 Tax=Psychromonas sp. MB-3u-54 TaxID=2058319 RepID=UPI000C33D7C5|nr:P-II family nitrogen regulator [Psychromonas sp. MB-3u-54]PKH02107.1 P-II family nitrogen regulator [Psychromonas sp. MB-3u-54]